MTGQIDDATAQRAVQGERVLVYRPTTGAGWILTIVRVITDGEGGALHLVNRDAKNGKPDWVLTQALFSAMQPMAKSVDNCQWQLKIK